MVHQVPQVSVKAYWEGELAVGGVDTESTLEALGQAGVGFWLKLFECVAAEDRPSPVDDASGR